MNVGLLLKRIAKQKRYTAAEISRISGVSESYLSMLFNGRINDPQLKNFYKICQALGVSVDDVWRESLEDE